MRLLVAALLVALSGCEVVDRPNKSVPADFEVRTLDGAVLTKKELLGKKWVINFWLPG